MKLSRLRSGLARRARRSTGLRWLGRFAPERFRATARRLLGETAALAEEVSSYSLWLRREKAHAISAEEGRARYDALSRRPLVSVILPVHDPELADLKRALLSVEGQYYRDWEICIADDGSRRRDIRKFLERYRERDRVKHVRVEEPLHIAGATNAAIAMAEGEFLAFLDHDDELAPEALLEVVSAIGEDPELDVIYSDHDIIDASGTRRSPSLKPGWSPELLLSYMYLGHLKVYRARLVRELGGLRPGFEGSADYDLALRLTEKTDRIHHVARVLYHWRAAPSSMASSGRTKAYSYEAGRRAVQEALDRRGVSGEVIHPEFAREAHAGIYQIRFTFPEYPPVTIVIPTRDRLELLAACIRSLEEKTTYPSFRILIVDNESSEPRTLEYLESTPHRVVPFANGGKFDFAAMNNFAVSQVDTEYFVLLNNDTLVESSDWLEGLVGFARMPRVGAVGAKLLYADRRIQHAGVVLGVQGLTGHALQPLHDAEAPVEYAQVPRNYLAATAACMLTRKSVFQELGGLDAEHLKVGWNDVDYCLRLREHGYRVVVNPSVVLLHLESQSRGDDKNPAEVEYMKKRWGAFIENDPYFNENFSRIAGDFRLKLDPDESRHFYYGEAHAS